MAAKGNIINNNKSGREYIRHAGKNDLCAIREIWRNIFTADEDYLDVIFNDLYPLLDAYVYTIDEKVVSVAFAIPITLIERNAKDSSAPKETTYYGRYLYGVATLDEARGRGLSRKLVKHIKEHYTAAGEDFIITRPAEESLFSFYKSQGFSLPLYRQELTFNLNHLCQSSKSLNCYRETADYNIDISAKELSNLRTDLSQNIFEWSIPILECILKLFKVEKSVIRHSQECKNYFIGSCYSQESDNTTTPLAINNNTSQNLAQQENQRKLIIQENNFNSLDKLFSNILKINDIIINENNRDPHTGEFDKTESITIIQPVKANTKRSTDEIDNNLYVDNISEFALCMPLSDNITDELIQTSFFNFTME